MRLIPLLALSLLATTPATLAAQEPAPSSPQSLFLRQAAGASLGSLVSAGIAAGVEVLAYPSGFYSPVPVFGLFTSAGSVSGLHLSTREPLRGSPLIYGALGALAGAYVGALVADNVRYVPMRAVTATLGYSVTQGVVTALGARIARSRQHP